MINQDNSFITESEFYTHLDTRLNAEEFSYLTAVYEVADLLQIAQLFNDMRGQAYLTIKAAIDTAGLSYLPESLQSAYDTLTASKTSTQIKNAKALILATRLINQLEFIGSPASVNQPLQWPRLGAVDRNYQPIASNTIPANLKTAAAELALFLLRHDTTDINQYQQLYLTTSSRTGESSVNLKPPIDKGLPDNVLNILKPLLVDQSLFSAKLIC